VALQLDELIGVEVVDLDEVVKLPEEVVEVGPVLGDLV
jgi:hypothetical protein